MSQGSVGMWTKSTISDVRPVGVLDADSVLLQLTRPESAHDGNIVVPAIGRAAALCGDVAAPRVCRTSRVGRPMRRCADAPTQFRRLAADLPSRPRSGAKVWKPHDRPQSTATLLGPYTDAVPPGLDTLTSKLAEGTRQLQKRPGEIFFCIGDWAVRWPMWNRRSSESPSSKGTAWLCRDPLLVRTNLRRVLDRRACRTRRIRSEGRTR